MSRETDHAAWLAELKVGDEVAIAVRHGLAGFAVVTVVRTTKTIIDCGPHGEFNRKNGYRRGGSGYYTPRIEPVTDEILATNRRNRCLRRLQDQKWSDFSDETLAEIVKLLPPEKT